MFTGIVEEIGTVAGVDPAEPADAAASSDALRLRIRGPLVTSDSKVGDSIAVNGVCLTVAEVHATEFTADVMRTTLAQTGLAGLRPGDRVNLERALTLSSRLGGHLVQGHVDGRGRVQAWTPGARAETGDTPGARAETGDPPGASDELANVLRIALPADLARYLVPRGSIAIDGVSLTVSAVGRDWFEVSLIPQTLSSTTLGSKSPGDSVNLEADVVAKYVEGLLEGR